MKRISVFIAIVLSLAILAGFTYREQFFVKGTAVLITEEGDLILDIMPQKLMDKVQIGETAYVTIGTFHQEMLFVEQLIPEEGRPQLLLDREDWTIRVCLYNGNFFKTYQIRENARVRIRKA